MVLNLYYLPPFYFLLSLLTTLHSLLLLHSFSSVSFICLLWVCMPKPMLSSRTYVFHREDLMTLLMVSRLICTPIRERQSKKRKWGFTRSSVDSVCLVQFQVILKKTCEATTHLNLICHDRKKNTCKVSIHRWSWHNTGICGLRVSGKMRDDERKEGSRGTESLWKQKQGHRTKQREKSEAVHRWRAVSGRLCLCVCLPVCVCVQ